MSGTHAFPRHFQSTESGMLLRDYFAAKAMQSMVSWPADARPDGSVEDCATEYARVAYIIADAMMEERHR